MQLTVAKIFLSAIFILFHFSRSEFCHEAHGLIYNDKVLIGDSYKSVITRGILACNHKCLADPVCTSYNYQSSTEIQGACELNNEGVASKELLQERKGSVFVRLRRKAKPKSCLEAWNQGARLSGFYVIQGRTECLLYEMYCDFSSEPGWAWTLVMSQSFGSRGGRFATSPFLKRKVNNQRNPNWENYRIGKGRMWVIKEQSSHWRVTCDFPKFGVDFRDYARATFKNLNPITYSDNGKCCEMDYINIRGHNCTGCTAAWWQTNKKFLTHFSDQDECQFGKTPGSIENEANFGGYWESNTSTAFRCSSTETSTTNYWFGGRV